MPDKKILLETKDLKKYFHTPIGDLHAVDSVSIKIPKGETLGVVGESGCGKSTLGHSILRLSEPNSGQVLFDGRDILKCNKHEMRKLRTEMQIIFQDPYASLNPRLTVSETIAQPMLVNKVCRKDELGNRVSELMDTVGLASRLYNAYPHELDGGRRQRIGIARALALNPRFIVCDEPVSALDVSIQAQILNLLMDLQEERSLTYMFITHNLSVVKHISNEIMVMYLGQCIEMTDSRELFKNPLHPYTQALLDSIPVPRLQSRDKKRKIIKGEIVSPIDPVPGCRFAPRCPKAIPKCTERDIPLRNVSENHQVACVLFEK
ncbi:MAG TPA: peptide ABC transporter ATP-binding protein [Ruminiclostridium sp.]|nr:peptide ABC transporter ATP-binding protein [Ruminiclostridium sp.]